MKKYLSVYKSKLKIMADYIRDYKRYADNSYYRNKKENRDLEHIEGMVIRLYHGVEKGLSISNFKKEFGLSNITLLQKLLLELKQKNYSNNHILSAIVTLRNYYEIHQEPGTVEFEKNKKFFYDNIFSNIDYKGGTKPSVSLEQLGVLNYQDFFNSRASIREFDVSCSIDKETILEVLDIAKKCPSACNRQAMKIYYSIDVDKNSELLSYQNGSRTFRHAVPGVFIVCSDTRFQEGAEERNLGFIEGGIWIMSLVNALHYKKLGSCVLNWCVRAKHDEMFRKNFNIPSYYNINAFIAFGKPIYPQNAPFSIRRNSRDFLDEIK
ncbi:TPA: nitroreductase family protein [Klebsiella quasipneumoniae subsp. similipneumoniae]|nr:nitroreductase family protein [Klebsiella quasipneumoniae subsp. similipneumoniae]